MPDPFISVADLTSLIGRDVTADPGAIIACDAACDVCRTIAQQDFNASTTTEKFDGTGTDSIVLSQFPVSGAGTVVVNGSAVTDYQLTANGLLLRGSANASGITDGWDQDCYWPPVWPRGRQNVTVTYDHGYLPDALPRDVRLVALQLAARIVVQGIAQAETVGDVQISYGQAADDLTVNELRILGRYNRTQSF